MNRFKILLPVLFILCFTQCEQNPKEEKYGDYLLSYEKVKTLTASDIQTQLSLASIIYPELSSILNNTSFGTAIYRVEYLTTFMGEDITASGLVCVPDGEGPFPVLSFQNGTNTCHAEAPSVNVFNTLYSLVGAISGNGYIITIPDYLGFGSSSQILHPYLHRSSSDQAVIDMLYASEELLQLPDFQVSHDNKLFLMGYSQGGWATLSLLNTLETQYSTDFNPVAAACGAGSYDLPGMTKTVLSVPTHPNPMYMAYFVYSRISNDIITKPLEEYINSPYTQTIPSLFDGSNCNATVNNQLPDSLHLLLTPKTYSLIEENITVPELENELMINSVPAWNTLTPLRFFHSKGDRSVPYQQSENIYDAFSQLGVQESKLDLLFVDTLDHNEAVIPWGIDAIAWFNEIRLQN